MKLLLATQNKDIFSDLVETLSVWGYSVTTAEDGYDALIELQNGDSAPVMAIIDNDLPSMEGTEVVRRLRHRVDAPYQYLILLGSSDDLEDRLISMDMGADVYVNNTPLNLVELRVHLQVGRRIHQEWSCK